MAIMKTLSDRARDNLRIFEPQDLARDRHTIKDHLKKIYSKFQVYTRAQLVSLLFK